MELLRPQGFECIDAYLKPTIQVSDKLERYVLVPQ
jgi:hypothetical protein